MADKKRKNNNSSTIVDRLHDILDDMPIITGGLDKELYLFDSKSKEYYECVDFIITGYDDGQAECDSDDSDFDDDNCDREIRNLAKSTSDKYIEELDIMLQKEFNNAKDMYILTRSKKKKVGVVLELTPKGEIFLFKNKKR